MNLQFTKMHGLGNDFLIFDAINQTVALTSEQIRYLADRRFGVGCDQVLLVEKPRTPDTEFYFRIYNSDGSEVEQCGNGARCFARFVLEKGLTKNTTIKVGTAKGQISLYLEADEQVRVDMGAPVLEPAAIPFLADQFASSYSISVLENALDVGVVSMGNPHAVLIVDNIDAAEVEQIGSAMQSHASFPQKVNVGFMQIHNRHHISLRVFERGVGETLACGTGACAAVVSGCLRGLLDERVTVALAGGELVIRWQGQDSPVWMTGSATTVFEGHIDL